MRNATENLIFLNYIYLLQQFLDFDCENDTDDNILLYTEGNKSKIG